MANNKVMLSNGTVIMDVTDTTATASDVASGKYFYAADGVKTLGTASGGGGAAADFLEALLENSADLRTYTEIPASPTSISNYGFYYKSNLALTSLPDSVTSIGTNAFESCSNLALTSLPSGLTSVGNSAFYNCYNLALTSLPSGLTSIGNSAFFSCSRLAITTIPDGVTTINNAAFRQCTSLTELTIPSSVTKIDIRAFYGNTGMTAYHMLRTTPPTLANTNAFQNIPSGCKIYVPTGCLSAYQSASNWSTYASKMEEE